MSKKCLLPLYLFLLYFQWMYIVPFFVMMLTNSMDPNQIAGWGKRDGGLNDVLQFLLCCHLIYFSYIFSGCT